jgi:hypothetical protein
MGGGKKSGQGLCPVKIKLLVVARTKLVCFFDTLAILTSECGMARFFFTYFFTYIYMYAWRVFFICDLSLQDRNL